jgi:hypothetical protein
MVFAQFSFVFKASQSPLGSRHFKSSKLLFIKAEADRITTHEYHHTTSKSQTLLSSPTNTSTPPGPYSTFNARLSRCLHHIIMKPFASFLAISVLVAIAVAQDSPSPASQYLNATEVEKHGCARWGCTGTPPSAGSLVAPESLLVACSAIFSLLASLA